MFDAKRRHLQVSRMDSRAVVRQLVKELMQAQPDAEELRKRVRILNRRKYKDEDDDDPD